MYQRRWASFILALRIDVGQGATALSLVGAAAVVRKHPALLAKLRRDVSHHHHPQTVVVVPVLRVVPVTVGDARVPMIVVPRAAPQGALSVGPMGKLAGVTTRSRQCPREEEVQ